MPALREAPLAEVRPTRRLAEAVKVALAVWPSAWRPPKGPFILVLRPVGAVGLACAMMHDDVGIVHHRPLARFPGQCFTCSYNSSGVTAELGDNVVLGGDQVSADPAGVRTLSSMATQSRLVVASPDLSDRPRGRRSAEEQAKGQLQKGPCRAACQAAFKG